MEYAALFSEDRVVGFLLLFIRFAALFIATPIFSHKNIPATIKATYALFFTIVFYPIMPDLELEISVISLTLAILSEFILGLSIGIVLQLAYHVITFAGGQISFMMGFSMASAIDPQTGVSMPIISQFLSLIALMVLFSLNLHHWIIMYVYESLPHIKLGGFLLTEHLFKYIIYASGRMFMIGFVIAFPIIALSWLADIIFGMLMKSMPQFNLLVIGFPIKIGVAFVVIIAVVSSIMLVVKEEMQLAFNFLGTLF